MVKDGKIFLKFTSKFLQIATSLEGLALAVTSSRIASAAELSHQSSCSFPGTPMSNN
jgi:hypothetical protein